MTEKIFASFLSKETNWQTELESLATNVHKKLNRKRCHLLIIFISEPYSNLNPQLLFAKTKDLFKSDFIIGCNSSGVIGGQTEIEMKPAISVMAMHLPGVDITPFSIFPEDLKTMIQPTDLIQKLDIYPTDKPKFLIFADPLTCNSSQLLNIFNKS